MLIVQPDVAEVQGHLKLTVKELQNPLSSNSPINMAVKFIGFYMVSFLLVVGQAQLFKTISLPLILAMGLLKLS